MRTRQAWYITALGLFLCAAPASAQDAADLGARRGLIEQAQQARAAGNHQQALDFAERASRIQMSPSLRLFVAQEQNSLGRLAEAYGNADTCMREAEADTTQRNREQVAATCRSLATEIRPRLGRVTVQVPASPPSDLAVTVGGNAVRAALWGVPYSVSPGHVVVEASARGFAPFHAEVDVTANANVDVPVTLTAQAGGTTTTETHHEATHSTQATTQTQTTQSSGGSIIPPVALIAVGVAGLVVGAVFFFVLRGNELSQVSMICPNRMCPDSTAADRARPHDSAATTWAIVGGVAAGVGVVAIAAGVVLFVVTRGHSSSSASAIDVIPLRDGAMLGLHGSF